MVASNLNNILRAAEIIIDDYFVNNLRKSAEEEKVGRQLMHAQNRVRDIVDHNLRNKDDFRNSRLMTEKYKHSIFMDGIRLWNNLPDDVKDLDSFDSFCAEIKPLAKRNELYNRFTREANIAHAQLRMQCSNLDEGGGGVRGAI